MLQLLTILRSMKNGSRKLFVYNMLYVGVFSIIYYIAHHYIEPGFGKYNKEDITMFDTLHFSFVTQTTNGYGDMFINSSFLKFVNLIHLFGLLALNLLMDIY